MNNGKIMYNWAVDLYPLHRSITGEGVRSSLKYIKEILPGLDIKEIPSGTPVYDWIVPEEWNIEEAWIADEDNNKIIDFKNNNLHVLGYSVNVNKHISLEELNKHLYSKKNLPDAIPYVTSYYEKRWGFCLSQNQREVLKDGIYHVFINSSFSSGVMNYADILIPGDSKKEVLLSTYICHPSMANNELSGPVVTIALALWLKSLKKRNYSYRIVFKPETIGTISYISENFNALKNNVIAGFNITCVGDNNSYSFLPTRKENTIIDDIAKQVLSSIDNDYKSYTWLDRGSDERQYCSPGVDLPIVSIMRTKYGEYPEYHTSKDDLNFISEEGLFGGFTAIKNCIEIVENNIIYKVNTLCEPKMDKLNLYPTLSLGQKMISQDVDFMMNIISLCDGEMSVFDISKYMKVPFNKVNEVISILHNNRVISKVGYSI